MMWSHEDNRTNNKLTISKLNASSLSISKITSFGIVSISSLAILLLGLFVLPLLSATEPTHAATPVEPTISITPASGITMDMTPAGGTAGSFSTATASVTVNSTNVSGYTLTMNTETTDPDLKNSKIDYTDPTKADLKITNLTASTTESNFSPNKWGYNVSKSGTYLKGASGTYVPVPNSGSSTADKQIDATTSAGNGTYTFTYGVKANNNLPAGAYNNTLVFSATGNALPKYSLTINFAGSGVSSVKVCLVSGNCSGSDLVGTVSSSGGSVSNLTYTDSYYLYPTFSTNYELDNWAKTSGEGTLSSTSATNPTFTIGLGNGTVTITGKQAKLYMWNATSADCGTTMWDNRDGTERSYTTATIGSLCWMTKNLSLGKSTTTALTSSTSNVSSSGYTLPASSTSGFDSDSAANVYNSGSTTCSSSSACYAYYSWEAAAAGSTKSSGEADYDICPKGWRLPTQAELTTLKNSYNTGAKLVGSPFLGVYAGSYYNSKFSGGGSSGYYWSSTITSSTTGAYRLYFDSSSANIEGNLKRIGEAVRCVMKPPTMQEATASYLATAMPNDGDTTNLVDSRNGEGYSIAKIGGKYWMTKNLMLGGSSTIQLTQDDSNVSSSGYTLPASSTSGFSSDTATNIYNSGSTTCSSSSACYAYYSWKAATAGSTKSSGAATYDICPKGWRLPTKAEFDTLKSSYSTGAQLVASPFLGVYSGYYNSSQFYFGGSRSDYWSSTAYSSTDAYRLGSLGSNNANVDHLTKRRGYAVRCVFKS